MRGVGRSLLAVAAGLALLIVASISAASVLAQPISSDPYTNSGPQHRTQVEPDSFAFGSTIVAVTQSGRYFGGGGSSNIVYSSSRDNGQTWTTGGLPGTTVNEGGPWPRISDPSIAYDPRRGVWLALGLGIDSGGNGHILLVNRSTDGGLTWSNPVTAGVASGFWDKTWIGCDTWAASPYYGNCYIEFDDNSGGNAMRMVTSTDGGLTWGPIRSPASSPSGLGGQPVVQTNGTVVVTYTANYNGIYAFRSTDGGASWTSAVFVGSQQGFPTGGNMRDPPMPTSEVDAAGKVYVAWRDCRFRSGCSSNDIVLSTSTDGVSWTSPSRIPIDPTTSTVDHFIPGLAVDRATSGSSAHLALGYYYFPVANCGTCQLNFGFVSSLDGGATWTPGRRVHGPMQVTWIASTNQGNMVGDYVSTSFTGDGKAHPVFSMAKANIGSAFRQQLGQATFDITHPPDDRLVKMRKDKVLYRPRPGNARTQAPRPRAN